MASEYGFELNITKVLQKAFEFASRERKQAVSDIRMLGRMGQNICPVCAHYNHGAGLPDECPKCLKEDNFKWRGVKDE